MTDPRGGDGADRKSVVRVMIVGEEYSIRSEASPEHTRAVARYVDQAIRRVMNSTTTVETHKVAILAALQITDELFRERETAAELTHSAQALGAEIRRLLPPAKRASAGRPAEPDRDVAAEGRDERVDG